jgi:hypothetical protein
MMSRLYVIASDKAQSQVFEGISCMSGGITLVSIKRGDM